MCITLVNNEQKNGPISETINRLKRIFVNEVCLYQGNLSDFKILKFI